MNSVWPAGAAAFLLAVAAMLLRGWHVPLRRRAAPTNRRPVTAVDDGLDIGAEIAEILLQFELRAKDRGVAFTLAIGSRLVARVAPDALRQSVAALLENALSRTANGAVLVAAGQQGGRLRVAVSDDGPFGDDAGTRTALRPVSELLASHGGSLEIDNRAGEGMTVTMRLPATSAVGANAMPFTHPGSSAATPA